MIEYYANVLTLQENCAQLSLINTASSKALSKVYLKVYAAGANAAELAVVTYMYYSVTTIGMVSVADRLLALSVAFKTI